MQFRPAGVDACISTPASVTRMVNLSVSRLITEPFLAGSISLDKKNPGCYPSEHTEGT